MTSNTIFTAMAGLQAITAQMEVSSSNLANLQTPGYAALQAATIAAPYIGPNATGGADATALKAWPDTTPGSLTRTGDSFNVGLGGDAWLEVQTANGIALTRNGTLQLSSAGILSDGGGNPVLSVGGQPISLPSLAKLEIASDGTVSGTPASQPGAAAQVFGQISLVATPTGGLSPIGSSLYLPASGVTPQATQTGSAHQGYLNASNVDQTRTMMDLIAGSRSYQLQTELLKTQSNSSQQLNSLLAQG